MDEQTLRGFHNADTIQVRSVNGHDFHNAVTQPGLIAPKISFNTCARINAIINYARLDIYVYMGESLARVLSIKPGNDDYIELVVDNDGDIIEMVTGSWIPFVMYLRRN